MSELAYNMQGDRFEPPPLATYWRVRRLKPGGRGTPDVMFGADGAPLMIAIDTELAEFRKLVNHDPGRYRLDPVDDNHKACEDGCPAYLQIAAEAEAPRTQFLARRPAGQAGDRPAEQLACRPVYASRRRGGERSPIQHGARHTERVVACQPRRAQLIPVESRAVRASRVDRPHGVTDGDDDQVNSRH